MKKYCSSSRELALASEYIVLPIPSTRVEAEEDLLKKCLKSLPTVSHTGGTEAVGREFFRSFSLFISMVMLNIMNILDSLFVLDQ